MRRKTTSKRKVVPRIWKQIRRLVARTRRIKNTLKMSFMDNNVYLSANPKMSCSTQANSSLRYTNQEMKRLNDKTKRAACGSFKCFFMPNNLMGNNLRK